MQTGHKLRELRIQANMTQEQLAEKLFVSRDLVSKWENNERRIDYKTVTEIAGLFGVSTDEIAEKSDILADELSECIPTGFDSREAELETVLNSFLRTLQERERGIFIRRYYFMDSISDIADMYRISENNTRIILHRVRKKLKKYFSEVN